MNPKGGEASHFEAPSFDGLEQVGQNQEAGHENILTPEATPSKQTSAPVTSLQSVLIPDSPAPAIPVPVDDTTVSTLPSHQDNSDQLGKHWLERTKGLIEETKEDPFKQKNEVSKIKAEYIEKRFNKKLKVDDAVA